MHELLDDMDDALADMPHCASDAMPQMLEQRTHLSSEMNEHHAVLEACADVAAARAETERYAATMLAWFDGMDVTLAAGCHSSTAAR
jgi:hypothetical protein